MSKYRDFLIGTIAFSIYFFPIEIWTMFLLFPKEMDIYYQAILEGLQEWFIKYDFLILITAAFYGCIFTYAFFAYKKYKKNQEIKISIFNLLTLVISLIALFISIESNNISRDTLKSKMTLVNDYSILGENVNYQAIDDAICFSDKNQSYYVTQSATQSFTIANNGGKGASLVDIYFTLNDNFFWSGIDKLIISQKIDGKDKEIDLPMNIPSGETISLTAKIKKTIPGKWDKILIIDKPNAISIFKNNLHNSKESYWTIRFSDGSMKLMKILPNKIFHNFKTNYEEITEKDLCTEQ